MYRAEPERRVSVNDEIGLDPFCSYEIADHLCDLEMYEGLRLVRREGNLYFFEGGTQMALEEAVEAIDPDRLDSETLLELIMLSVDACYQNQVPPSRRREIVLEGLRP